MKYFCPKCNKEIILDEASWSFITTYNQNKFLSRDSKLNQVCQNCKAKLYFNWKIQKFAERNLLLERLGVEKVVWFPFMIVGRVRKLSVKKGIIISIACIILALLVSWILVELMVKGIIPSK